MSQLAITIQDVEEAAERIRPFVRHTAVSSLPQLAALVGASAVVAKLENTQDVGAFKIRGAMNAVHKIPEEVGRQGVIASSAGNHAQGLAAAAKTRGFPAHVVMQETASPLKIARTRALGATVYLCDPHEAARYKMVDELHAKIGGAIIPSFNHPDVIAGQGTAALELVVDLSTPLDLVLVPISGGGLISGIATVLKERWPHCTIVGVEPEGANDTLLSLQASKRISLPAPRSIADGLLSTVGELTFPIIQAKVDRVITVSEAQIRNAVRYCYEKLSLIVEPSAAVSFAALLNRTLEVPGKRVGIILSGGNVAIEQFLEQE